MSAVVETGGADDGTTDGGGSFREPPPPDDRLWRHPSEVAQRRPRSARSQPVRPHSPWPVALVSGLLGSVLTVGLVVATGALDRGAGSAIVREPVPSPARLADGGGGGRGGAGDVVRVAERTSPVIARIDVAGDDTATGSGVLVRDDGHLVTSAHVVDGARSINVVLADGSERPGRLLGADPLTDVAVVKIDGTERFPVAVLGTAADLRVGQPTITIGSPIGLIGGSSVTTGVVSALGRRVAGREGPPLLGMIQTDAPVAPGSSGGALLDSSGAVIGITTAVAASEAGYQGLGFATPIDIARSVADDIIATGRPVHVWLGIEGRDLDAASAQDRGVAGGAVVVGAVESSPAERAGVRPGDIVVEVAGKEVTSMSALVIALRGREPGEEIDLGVVRDGERVTVGVELATRPPES